MVQTKKGNLQGENLHSFVFLHIQFPPSESPVFLKVFTTVPQCRDFYPAVFFYDTMPLSQFLLPLARLGAQPNSNSYKQSGPAFALCNFSHAPPHPPYSILLCAHNQTSKSALPPQQDHELFGSKDSTFY